MEGSKNPRLRQAWVLLCLQWLAAADLLDPREFLGAGVLAGFERRNPPAGGGAKLLEVNPPVRFGEGLQLFQAAPEQRPRARAVAALIVVERGRHLNNALKKSLLRLRGGQPDFLPGFVRVKEVATVELVETLPEFGIRFVCVQASHSVPAGCALRETRHNSRLHAAAGAAKALGRAVNISIEIPGVHLGVIEVEGARVAPAELELAREMNATCERLRRQLTLEQVAELPSIRGVRAMFRAWGVDPARYRPSAEALLRRVMQGKGLYRVSNAVDINNLGSVETGWPYGTYDAARIDPPVAFRLGAPGETYEGIGKHTWHLEARPVLADQQGPFGSPISDSVRTMITEATAALLTVIFAPATSARAALDEAVERCARRLEQFAGAKVRATTVIPEPASLAG